MGDVYRVIAPPPVIFALGLVLGLLLDALAFDSDLGSWAVVAGIVLIAVGVVLLAWFEIAFKRAGTTILPGHAADALVISGAYRFTRNPGYLGMTLLGCGIALLAGAPWALLGVVAAVVVVDRNVIRAEERYLEGRFGEQYRAYRARVRRWI